METAKSGIGDGAMGLWAALEEAYPGIWKQRYWMHQTGNVLNCVSKSIQSKAKSTLYETWQAEARKDAHKAFDLFIVGYFSSRFSIIIHSIPVSAHVMITFMISILYRHKARKAMMVTMSGK